MRRFMLFGYSLVCYAGFMLSLVYLVGFLLGIGVPKDIDDGAVGSPGAALAVNLGLLGLFALQHSGMARQRFKRWIVRILPEEVERSTYVLLSTLVMVAIFVFWRPLPHRLWDVQGETARAVVLGLFGLGFAVLVFSTFMLGHFDLAGVRQTFVRLRGGSYGTPEFSTPLLYRVVRHPLYVGWITMFWAAPTMSVGHLLFSLGMTGYILAAIPVEERDLVREFGREYVEYRDATPGLVPFARRSRTRRPAAESVGVGV